MLEKDLLFDKRIMARNVLRGTVTREQVEEHMKSLPDSKVVSIEQEISIREGEFPIEYVEPEE